METIYIIVGFLSFMALLGWYAVYIGNKNAKEAKYNLMYRNFKTMLYDPYRPVNKVSWKELNKCFTEIEDMKWNAEKTDVLRGEFLDRYKVVADEIEAEFNELMSQNEFSPESYFGQ